MRKRRPGRDPQARIQSEIERRVFEESRRIADERHRAQDDQAQAEALAEVSQLPPAAVRRIAKEVRAEHEASRGTASRQARKLLGGVGTLLLVALPVAALLSAVVVRGTRAHRAQAEVETLRKYFALVEALEKGNTQMAEYLLEQGAPLAEPGAGGGGSRASALMTAADYEQSGFVRLLLARGADVTLKESGGKTALDFAVERRSEALVRVLGQAMADAAQPDSPTRRLWGKGIPFSRYSFVDRVTRNDVEAVRLFLAGGMDVNAGDDLPAIAHAALEGNAGMVRLLLSEARPGNKPDTRRALEISVDRGHAEVARTLLEHGADPKVVPVYNALPHLEIAALLLDHGGDVNGPSGADQVPALVRVLDTWDTAVDPSTRKLWVRFLLDHGANVHDRGGGVKSALDRARAWGNAEVVQWITDAASRSGPR